MTEYNPACYQCRLDAKKNLERFREMYKRREQHLYTEAIIDTIQQLRTRNADLEASVAQLREELERCREMYRRDA